MAKARAGHILQYLAFRLVEVCVHMLPERTLYDAAAAIGDAYYRFVRKHRRRATEHVRRSFPDWPEQKVRQTARRSMRSMGALLFEVLLSPRRISWYQWRRHIRMHNASEALRMVVRRDRPLIFVTGHFGNWEVVGYTLAALGFPMYAIARRLDNPLIDEHVLGVRQRRGMTILDKRGATAEVPDILASNGNVCFIADQDAGRKGAFVDFLGRKASTYKSVALLAIHHDAPVIVGYGRRLGERFCFELGVQRIVYPHEWTNADDPVTWLTAEYTAALADAVRKAPEQYVWTHRRWKTRPRGEQPAEDGIA